MENKRLILVFTVLLTTSLACSLFGGGDGGSEVSPPSEGDVPPPSGSGKYDTEFPMPPKVENYMDLGDGAINYQTPMKLEDVVAFYRVEFEKAGYEERDVITSIVDEAFSIAWDGHPSGKAIVIQGVDLGNGTTNVNIRFEDV
jgi:hypothetical protein